MKPGCAREPNNQSNQSVVNTSILIVSMSSLFFSAFLNFNDYQHFHQFLGNFPLLCKTRIWTPSIFAILFTQTLENHQISILIKILIYRHDPNLAVRENCGFCLSRSVCVSL